jgi:DNA-binding response OmpR family regulator
LIKRLILYGYGVLYGGIVNNNSVISNPTRKGDKRSILAVDDDAKILRFVRWSLRPIGYEVITATDGEDALLIMEARKPDLIVLDIVMPGMDGFEVLRRIRVDEDTPVIAFSTHSSFKEQALHLGANDFLAKPFFPGELLKRIRVLLQN